LWRRVVPLKVLRAVVTGLAAKPRSNYRSKTAALPQESKYFRAVLLLTDERYRSPHSGPGSTADLRREGSRLDRRTGRRIRRADRPWRPVDRYGQPWMLQSSDGWAKHDEAVKDRRKRPAEVMIVPSDQADLATWTADDERE
jgi:hypothetical protein